MRDWAVYDDNDKLVTIIVEDSPCNGYSSLCGGCHQCLLKQADHAGYKVVELQTMDGKYGDGSDCVVCPKCGLCIDCGDCDLYGCGVGITKDINNAK